MDKYDWKAIDDRLLRGIRPTQNAVAVKFIKTQGELDAIPNVEYFKKQGAGCTALAVAGYFPRTVAIRPGDFLMHHCEVANALHEVDDEFLSGAALNSDPTKWHGIREDCAAHMRNMAEEGIPKEQYISIVASPIALGAIKEPDLISLQLLPGGAFHLLAGLVDKNWRKINFPYGGESTCADTWCYTFRTGKPGLSLGCRGDRSFGALQACEVRLTLTPADLLTALDGIERLARDQIYYPYYPMGLVPDF